MRFLRALLSFFDRTFVIGRGRQQPLDGPASRFIFNSNQFSASSHRVKQSAFLPPESGRLSVFLVGGLSDGEIWGIGGAVAAQVGKTLRARGDVTVGGIEALGLQVRRDDQPRRHANVVGWPSEKSQQKVLAQKLADAATLHVPE